MCCPVGGKKTQKLVFFQKIFLSVDVLSWHGLKYSLKALTTLFWGITSSFLILLTLQHLARAVSHAQIYLNGQTTPLLILCVSHNFIHLHLPKPELYLRSCKRWDLSFLYRQIAGTQEGKTVQCCSHIFINILVVNCHSLAKTEFITVLALTTEPSHLPGALQLPLLRLPRHKALFQPCYSSSLTCECSNHVSICHTSSELSTTVSLLNVYIFFF